MKRFFILCACLFFLISVRAQQNIQLALLKYRGGGDWYSNPTSLPNLVSFCNAQLGTNLSSQIATVAPSSPEIFNYPFVHITGHGNVVFDDFEAKNLRNYLISGGFLHIDDNYGMDIYIRKQMKNVFPELDFIELPASHPLFQQPFSFPNGIPKIHEHDGKPAQAFGLFYEGKLVCLYTYESDLGDGWEDQIVHNNSEETRLKALRMGANIIQFVFSK
ncbi:MAG: DUF4159 domain-containing protein [Lentimicrobiaceae bacterium]|jgi:hypothetical protein|nr:DUF4159 domain-containing protein [Lentimicrobiaceae bacterium]